MTRPSRNLSILIPLLCIAAGWAGLSGIRELSQPQVIILGEHHAEARAGNLNESYRKLIRKTDVIFLERSIHGDPEGVFGSSARVQTLILGELSADELIEINHGARLLSSEGKILKGVENEDLIKWQYLIKIMEELLREDATQVRRELSEIPNGRFENIKRGIMIFVSENAPPDSVLHRSLEEDLDKWWSGEPLDLIEYTREQWRIYGLRDEYFVKVIKDYLEKNPDQKVGLIVGGMHAEPVAEGLRKIGMGPVSIWMDKPTREIVAGHREDFSRLSGGL